MGREDQGGLVVERGRVAAVGVHDRGVSGLENIAHGPGAGMKAPHEQIVRIACGTAVAVSHVHQIILAVVHGDDVPHVGAGDTACDGIGGDIAGKAGQIAEILEALRIALADHFGLRILVKDPDQLPGVAVIDIVIQRVIIVIDQVADRVFVALELFVVRAAAVFADDRRRLADGVAHRRALFRIDLVGARRILRSDRETDLDDRARRDPGRACLVIPVQFKGAVREQGINERAEADTAGDGARIAKDRRSPLTRRDLRDHRAQLVVGFFRCSLQCGSDILDVEKPIAPGEQRIQHHAGIAVQKTFAAAAGRVGQELIGIFFFCGDKGILEFLLRDAEGMVLRIGHLCAGDSAGITDCRLGRLLRLFALARKHRGSFLLRGAGVIIRYGNLHRILRLLRGSLCSVFRLRDADRLLSRAVRSFSVGQSRCGKQRQADQKAQQHCKKAFHHDNSLLEK